MSDDKGGLILYRTEDGRADIQLRAVDGTVWLSQAELAELFDTTPQNITQHIRAVYAEGELDEAATCKDYLQVQTEGGRIETRMSEWIAQTDRFLTFNERSILSGAGHISHDRMESIMSERFSEFDARGREQERLVAEQEAADDLAQLESAAAKLVPGKKTKGRKKP